RAPAVLESHPDRFQVVALAAGRSVGVLGEQVERLRPRMVGVTNPGAARALDVPDGVTLAAGPDALVEIATRDDVDLLVVATGGIVSLVPGVAARGAGVVRAPAGE